MDDEREALCHRRQEITRQLDALTTKDSTIDADTLAVRSELLLRQIREIKQRLAEIDLDELCMRRMEGGE